MTDIAAAVTEATASEPVISEGPQGQDPNPGLSWIDRLKARYGEDPTDVREAELSGTPATSKTKEPGETAPSPKDGAKEAKTAEETAKTEEATEKPAVETPKQAPNRVELRNAQLMSENQRVVADNISLKTRAETAESFQNQVKEDFARHPFKALEKYAGKALNELVEMGKKGVFDKPEVDLPPEIKKKLDWVEQEQARRAVEDAKVQRQAEFSNDLPKVQKYLEEFSSKLPFSSMLDGAANDILEVFYQRDDAAKKNGTKRPDIRAVAAELEEVVAQNMIDTFSNVNLIKYLASNPDLRKVLTSALGLSTEQQQKLAAPVSGTQGNVTEKKPLASAQVTSVAAVHNEVPERTDRELSEDELQAERLRLFRQAREAGRFSPT